MIVSAHRLVGFWFESGATVLQGPEQAHATEFLRVCLDRLCQLGPGHGAIHSGYDPACLNSIFPGYRWLSYWLRWMKNSFAERFDDEAEKPNNPEKRGAPFPAFWYALSGPQLPHDGIQVLIGHDFTVIHEFSISSQPNTNAKSEYAELCAKRFLASASSSEALLTATFRVVSGTTLDAGKDIWLPGEFAPGLCPGVKTPIYCAVRSDKNQYEGLILVESQDQNHFSDADSILAGHMNASAYLRFLCTLLVNDAKTQFEFRVADNLLRAVKQNLGGRLCDLRPSNCASTDSKIVVPSGGKIIPLFVDHLNDRRLLDQFDQLVNTCKLNIEQFKEVSTKLLQRDNQWTAERKDVLQFENSALQKEQDLVWTHFKHIEQIFKGLNPIQAQSSPTRSIRNQVFISYSHEDHEIKQQLVKHLNVVFPTHVIWHDSRIQAGEIWMDRLRLALSQAKVAILLVSIEFLNSQFITQHEVLPLLRAQENDGLILFPILVNPCNYEESVLQCYQRANRLKALSELRGSKRARELETICRRVREAIRSSAGGQDTEIEAIEFNSDGIC